MRCFINCHIVSFHNMSYFLYQAVECSQNKGLDDYPLPAGFFSSSLLSVSTPDCTISFLCVFMRLPGLCLHLSSFDQPPGLLAESERCGCRLWIERWSSPQFIKKDIFLISNSLKKIPLPPKLTLSVTHLIHFRFHSFHYHAISNFFLHPLGQACWTTAVYGQRSVQFGDSL